MKIFVPLTKIDEEKRQVWGVAAVEQPDRAREIFDYATSKPNVLKWSGDHSVATGGKSLGNLRSMHGNIAAGRLIAITPNDVDKRFDIGTEIVDDNEWQKVLKGVYTGFSIGGDYDGPKWDDPILKNCKRYTAAINEISLVDRPCMPGAMFEAIKADGTHEMRKFAETSSLTPEKPPLGKCLYDVARLAGILASLNDARVSAESEAYWEADGSGLPGRLEQNVKDLSATLIAMVEEETSELTEPKEILQMKTPTGDLAKEAPKHLKEIGKHVEGMAAAHAKLGEHLAALQGGDGANEEDAEAKKAAPAGDLKKTDQPVPAAADKVSDAKPAADKVPAPADKVSDAKPAADKVEPPPVVKADAAGDLSKADPMAKYDDRLAKMEASQADTAGAITNLVGMLSKFMAEPAASKVAVSALGLRAVSKADDGGDLKKDDSQAAPTVESELKKAHAAGPNRRVI